MEGAAVIAFTEEPVPQARVYRTISVVSLVMAASLGGCSFFTGETKPVQPVMEQAILSPYPSVTTFAIAPAINLSGSRDFDSLAVSDSLFTEMQQVQGLNLLPVNKTLIAMHHLGMRSIENVADAQKLSESLGADGLIVPAITSYDPYNPPVVGMVLQLYTPPIKNPPENYSIRPPVILTNPGAPTVVADVAPSLPAPERQPVAQVNAVFNATNQSVIKELAVFARGRTQYDSALMDQKFLVDSDAYMRFVCHAMVRRLMEVERERVSDR